MGLQEVLGFHQLGSEPCRSPKLNLGTPQKEPGFAPLCSLCSVPVRRARRYGSEKGRVDRHDGATKIRRYANSSPVYTPLRTTLALFQDRLGPIPLQSTTRKLSQESMRTEMRIDYSAGCISHTRMDCNTYCGFLAAQRYCSCLARFNFWNDLTLFDTTNVASDSSTSEHHHRPYLQQSTNFMVEHR